MWPRSPLTSASSTAIGKGRMGSALMESLQNFVLFDRINLWVRPLTYFYIPKSARACLFPQSVNICCFCSGPINVDPICPQPRPRQIPRWRVHRGQARQRHARRHQGRGRAKEATHKQQTNNKQQEQRRKQKHYYYYYYDYYYYYYYY